VHSPLSLGLVLVMLFAVILGSAHHHDQEDHPDCAICFVVHHAASETSAPPSPPAIFLSALPALFAPLVLAVPVVRPTSLQRSRAPPR
jgi:hypothetical protein